MKIIDVRGCFWHAHRCQHGRRPAVRKSYWNAKLARNVSRDRKNFRTLRRLGWAVLVIWECETGNPEQLADRVKAFLTGESG